MWTSILTSDNKKSFVKEEIQKVVSVELDMDQPCSPTGETPATHWIFALDANKELSDKLLKIKIEGAEIFGLNPVFVLRDKNLRRIDPKKLS